MSRGLSLSMVCLAVAWTTMIPSTARPQAPKEPKVIATFGEPYGPIQIKKTDTGIVIRDAEELVSHSNKPGAAKDASVQKAMEAELAKLLKVERIDWSKQMILAVNGHGSGDGSGTIRFGALKIEDKILTVPWRQENRPSLGIVTPRGMILVDCFIGEVKFVPLATK